MEIVRCPKCHKRLFDMSDDLIGTISIQCRRCKTVVVFSFPLPARATGTYCRSVIPRPLSHLF